MQVDACVKLPANPSRLMECLGWSYLLLDGWIPKPCPLYLLEVDIPGLAVFSMSRPPKELPAISRSDVLISPIDSPFHAGLDGKDDIQK